MRMKDLYSTEKMFKCAVCFLTLHAAHVEKSYSMNNEQNIGKELKVATEFPVQQKVLAMLFPKSSSRVSRNTVFNFDALMSKLNEAVYGENLTNQRAYAIFSALKSSMKWQPAAAQRVFGNKLNEIIENIPNNDNSEEQLNDLRWFTDLLRGIAGMSNAALMDSLAQLVVNALKNAPVTDLAPWFATEGESGVLKKNRNGILESVNLKNVNKNAINKVDDLVDIFNKGGYCYSRMTQEEMQEIQASLPKMKNPQQTYLEVARLIVSKMAEIALPQGVAQTNLLALIKTCAQLDIDDYGALVGTLDDLNRLKEPLSRSTNGKILFNKLVDKIGLSTITVDDLRDMQSEKPNVANSKKIVVGNLLFRMSFIVKQVGYLSVYEGRERLLNSLIETNIKQGELIEDANIRDAGFFAIEADIAAAYQKRGVTFNIEHEDCSIILTSGDRLEHFCNHTKRLEEARSRRQEKQQLALDVIKTLPNGRLQDSILAAFNRIPKLAILTNEDLDNLLEFPQSQQDIINSRLIRCIRRMKDLHSSLKGEMENLKLRIQRQERGQQNDNEVLLTEEQIERQGKRINILLDKLRDLDLDLNKEDPCLDHPDMLDLENKIRSWWIRNAPTQDEIRAEALERIQGLPAETLFLDKLLQRLNGIDLADPELDNRLWRVERFLDLSKRAQDLQDINLKDKVLQRLNGIDLADPELDNCLWRVERFLDWNNRAQDLQDANLKDKVLQCLNGIDLADPELDNRLREVERFLDLNNRAQDLQDINLKDKVLQRLNGVDLADLELDNRLWKLDKFLDLNKRAQDLQDVNLKNKVLQRLNGIDLADHALYDHLREIDEFLEPDQPSIT